MVSLEDVLQYENDEVVHRFARDYSVTFEDSKEIFVETKRWLWLCASEMAAAKDGVGARIPLLSEARVIDLMWHTFLLFTRDYADFCKKHFGFYVHHMPRTHVERVAWDKRVDEDLDGAMQERRATLRKGYEAVADRLGTATLKKWCEEFPERFAALH